MKLAVIGSRDICEVEIEKYLPDDISEIVSGGARGVDTVAKRYAQNKGIKITEFLPNYKRYGRAAPLKRNEEIAAYSDALIAFWDGSSKGTEYTVKLFGKLGKPVTIIKIK